MSEIESVKPILTVTDDEGDLILSSTGARGKAMAQAVLALAASARKIVIISDGEMKVMKRVGSGVESSGAVAQPPTKAARQHAVAAAIAEAGPDIQETFISDLEAGVTGEVATGEAPPPPKPPARRKPQIFQDAAAPPAPELAEAEMAQILAEAAQAEQDAAKVREDQRFQRQQAVQAQQEPSDQPADDSAEAAKPRKREPRALATTGRACGRCGGGGQIMGDAGFTGACPVCLGAGQIKTWDRALKVR